MPQPGEGDKTQRSGSFLTRAHDDDHDDGDNDDSREMGINC